MGDKLPLVYVRGYALVHRLARREAVAFAHLFQTLDAVQTGSVGASARLTAGVASSRA